MIAITRFSEDSDRYVGGIVVTSGRLDDICKVGGSRLAGSTVDGRLGSTVGSMVDGRLDGRVGRMDGRGSIVVRVGFGCALLL